MMSGRRVGQDDGLPVFIAVPDVLARDRGIA
jgi:hypothetical protein